MGDKANTMSGLGDSPRQTLVIAGLLYSFSLILINIAPFLVGMYVDHFQVSLGAAGVVQTVDQAGGLLGAVVGFVLMPRFGWKGLVLIALLIAAVSNALTAAADSYAVLCAVRFLAGFGAMLITTVTACVLAQATVPLRAYSAGLAAGMLLSAAAVWLLDALRIAYGDPIALGSGALWLGFGGLLALFLPRRLSGPVNPHGEAVTPRARRCPQTVGKTSLIVLLLFSVSINVIYVFIEHFGFANGLARGDATNALALGLLFAAAGSLIPTMFGVAGGHLKWISMTTLIFFGSLVGIYSAQTTVLFALAFGVCASAWCMGLAYYMSLIAENDPERRYTRMIYIVNAAAQSIGPAIGVLVLSRATPPAVFAVPPVPALLAVLLVAIALSTSSFLPLRVHPRPQEDLYPWPLP